MVYLAVKAAAEIIGTFFLVLAVLYTNFGTGGLSVGLTLMVLVFSLGPISGAHLNPAVSTTILFSKHMDFKSFVVYVLSQLLGACMASALYFFGLLGSLGSEASVASGDLGKALMAEFFFTLMLCEVVLHVAVADSSEGKQYFGMAIGFVLTVGAECVGGISGACFNPAVVLSFLFQQKYFPWTWFISYIVVEVVAAVLGAVLFKLKLNELGFLSKHEPVRKALAEFLGTFFLALAICLSPSGLLGVLIKGAALTALVYAYANVSGSHFNPAVSLVMFLNGTLNVVELGYYVLTQIISALLAFEAAHYIKGGEWKLVAGEGTNSLQEMLAEFFGTFVLVFTICSVTKSNELSDHFGWAIGVSLMAGAGSQGSISGGSLNPCVTIAAAVGHPLVKYVWYVLAELGGAAAAWTVFKYVNANSTKENEVEEFMIGSTLMESLIPIVQRQGKAENSGCLVDGHGDLTKRGS